MSDHSILRRRIADEVEPELITSQSAEAPRAHKEDADD